jgi:mannose-6-phosphate isomerase-like protein (cupin superfamily)
MKSIAICLLLAGASVMVADAPTFTLWTTTKMHQEGQDLAGQLNAQGLASRKLADMGNYNLGLVLRHQSGEAEVHEKMADILVIEGGEADLDVGGKVVNPKSTGPNEIRGSAIEGGARHHLVTGDVLAIPPGTPHRMNVPAGKEVLYMAIKVVQ